MILFRKTSHLIKFIFAFLCLIFFATQFTNAQETSQGKFISPPAEFKFKPDFKIYRGNGKPLAALTSFDPKAKSEFGATSTYFVNIATGNNSNDGFSKEKPFKSLWKALQKKGSKNIIITPGRYDYDDGWKGIASKDSLVIKSNGGPAIITTHIPVKFAKFAENIYKATKIHKERWGNVIDLSQELKNRVLVKAEKLPIKPGEYYVDKNDLYICPLDKRIPDEKILTLLAEPHKNPVLLADSYLENLELWGGRNCLSARIPKGKSVTLNKVVGRYSHGGTAFQFNVAGHGIIYKCKAYNNFSDDFNWHALEGKSGTAVEINSISRYAGTNNKSTSVNASTAHDRIKIIRINGDYQLAQNRIVGDVGNAQSWNIACVAQGSRHSDKASPWWSQNWSICENSQAWVDTCIGSNKNDTSKRGWSSERNAQIYFHNTDYTSGDVKFNKKPIEY